jgi:hypothetical protein
MMMMMNLQWIAIVTTLVMGMASAAPEATTMEMDSRRVLGSEHDPTVAPHCNEMEWKLIDDILVASANIMEDDETNHRHLQRVPSRCKTDCKGFASGFCPVPGCNGATVGQTSIMGDAGDKGGLDTVQTLPPLSNRRYLRSKEERDLQMRCKKACEGYVTGNCPVPGCLSYNQNFEATPLNDSTTTAAPPTTTTTPDGVRARTLESVDVIQMATTPCTEEQIKYVHRKFYHLIRTNAVSSTCQDLLKDSRQITCYRRHSHVYEMDTVV